MGGWEDFLNPSGLEGMKDYKIGDSFLDFRDGEPQLPGIFGFRVLTVGFFASIFFSLLLTLQIGSMHDISLQWIAGMEGIGNPSHLHGSPLTLAGFLFRVNDMGSFFLFASSLISCMLVWYATLWPSLGIARFIMRFDDGPERRYLVVLLLSIVGHFFFVFFLSFWIGEVVSFGEYWDRELFRVGWLSWFGTFFVAYGAVIGLSTHGGRDPLRVARSSPSGREKDTRYLSLALVAGQTLIVSLWGAWLLAPNSLELASFTAGSLNAVIVMEQTEIALGPFFNGLFLAIVYPVWGCSIVVSVASAVHAYRVSSTVRRVASTVTSIVSGTIFCCGFLLRAMEFSENEIPHVRLPIPVLPSFSVLFKTTFCFALFLMIAIWGFFFLLRFKIYPQCDLSRVISRRRLVFSFGVFFGLVLFPELLLTITGFKQLYWLKQWVSGFGLSVFSLLTFLISVSLVDLLCTQEEPSSGAA